MPKDPAHIMYKLSLRERENSPRSRDGAARTHSGGVDDVGQTGATVPTLVDDTHPAKALCTAADPCTTLVHHSLSYIDPLKMKDKKNSTLRAWMASDRFSRKTRTN